jgi:toxin HigB-1
MTALSFFGTIKNQVIAGRKAAQTGLYIVAPTTGVWMLSKEPESLGDVIYQEMCNIDAAGFAGDVKARSRQGRPPLPPKCESRSSADVSTHALPFPIQCETVYHEDVIRSFRSKDTAKLFRREQTRKYASFENAAKRKLDHLNAVASLSDLAAIPGNHFESLSGDRLGQYSIRINDRWRICFEWKSPDAYSVEIVDYH